jgi:hypothetical protein
MDLIQVILTFVATAIAVDGWLRARRSSRDGAPSPAPGAPGSPASIPRASSQSHRPGPHASPRNRPGYTPPAGTASGIPRERAGPPGMGQFAARWAGPWLWGVLQFFLLKDAWSAVLDWQGYVAGLPSHQIATRAVVNTCFATFCGMIISFRLMDRHGWPPRELRQWIYAVYMPLDLVTGLLLGLARPEVRNYPLPAAMGLFLILLGWLVPRS